MTTIVYEEIMTSRSANDSPRNVKKLTVKIMGDSPVAKNVEPSPRARRKTHKGARQRRPQGGIEVEGQFGPISGSYAPHVFTITAYLPHDGGRRLKLQCTPGQTVKQVIETEIPDIMRTGYQVFQYPSRARLNPERDASVLQDQEICIEPVRLKSPDKADDGRLIVVKELVRTEDTYLENLRNIFDSYMEPLRKWGLPQAEMNVLFHSLSVLCDLLVNFFSELEQAVKYWHPLNTCIASRILILLLVFFKECHIRVDSIMVQARELQLNLDQNELKLEQVQLRFPSDMLFLMEPLSSPNTRSRKSPSSFSPASKHGRFRSSPALMQSDSVDGHLGYGSRKTMRIYVQEGPVKLITGLQTHDRYFFLFDDLLLIAKPSGRQRSSSQHKAYKLKHRLRLSEMWIAEAVGAVLGTSYGTDTAFTIGWPITNCVAAFSTVAEKQLWANLFTKYTMSQRESVQPDQLSVQVVDHTKASNNLPVWVQVHSSHQAKGVLQRTVDLFNLKEGVQYEMWVKASKDEPPILLIGHEYPFAVQTYHNRHVMDVVGDNKQPSQLQFIIKKSIHSTATENPLSGSFNSSSKSRKGPFKSRNLIHWYRKRQTPKHPKNKKHRVFGIPLQQVFVNNQMPEILQEMLIILYKDGPTTLGIFRQSASFKKVKELRELIDQREPVDLSEVSIHVVAALLKDFLRNVPGGILVSTRYTEFVATNDIKELPVRAQHLKRILKRLPDENQEFLRYLLPLLHLISIKDEINCMNSINLAICFAPSLLWPDSGLDVIKNEVPPLVQFLIKHCPEIFENELPEIYRELLQTRSPGVENMDFVRVPSHIQYIPTKKDDGQHHMFHHHKQTSSIDETTTSEDSGGEDLEEERVPSNLLTSHKAGLTLSDSQLSHIAEPEPSVITSKPGQTVTVQLSGKQIIEPKSHIAAIKQSKKPERSNSYHLPGDNHYRQRHKSSNDPVSRRRSIATQQKNMARSKRVVPTLEPINGRSPPSSLSSLSQGYSPKINHRRRKSDDSISLSSQFGILPAIEVPPPMQVPVAARQKKHYSHSFSKPSDIMHDRPLPTSQSVSFYDTLLPVEPQESSSSSNSNSNTSRARSRSMGVTHVTKLKQDKVGPAGMKTAHAWPVEPHVVQTKPTLFQTGPASSSQSINSSRSDSSSSEVQLPVGRLTTHTSTHRPSGSPDLLSRLEQTPISQLDRDFIKDAISTRFGITSSVGSTQHAQQRRQSPDILQGPQRSIGLHRKQQKQWPSYDTAYNRGGQGVKQNSLSSVSEGLDDLPESEQHLNSLPRPHTADLVRRGDYSETSPRVDESVVFDADGNRIFPPCGYNSDTESSPSRTLNRQREKMKEVTSPGSIPSRYTNTRSTYQHLEPIRKPNHTDLRGDDKDVARQKQPSPAYGTAMQQQNRQDAALGYRGPSPAKPWSLQKSLDTAPKPEQTEEKDGQYSKIEASKVRLGLIPRQRSKSTSDDESGGLVVMRREPSDSVPAAEKTLRTAERHQVWLQHAPTPVERRRARAMMSKNVTLPHTSSSSSSSQVETVVVVDSRPNSSSGRHLQLPQTMSIKSRSSTMPNALSQQSPFVIGKQHEPEVRTVKVRAYEMPKPRAIRRIKVNVQSVQC